MLKLIAFDLDGTILRDNKELSRRSLEALELAAGKGIRIVPATGRLYSGIPEEIRTLPFVRYVIAANGAEVYDAAEGKVLRRAELTLAEAGRILAYIKGEPAILGCYRDGKGWMDREELSRMEEYAQTPKLAEIMKRVYTPVDGMENFLKSSDHTVQKLMLFYSDLEARKRTLERMGAELADLAVSTSVPNNTEINAREATKGGALKFLCEYLHLNRRESAAFGDGTNDITMIRQAGTGIAMGNACPEVLKAADQVTKSNDQDGVAVWIEEYLTGGH